MKPDDEEDEEDTGKCGNEDCPICGDNSDDSDVYSDDWYE